MIVSQRIEAMQREKQELRPGLYGLCEGESVDSAKNDEKKNWKNELTGLTSVFQN